ncbi:MAG: hypothetical protein VW521_13975 [Rhodospirillales bacterium]
MDDLKLTQRVQGLEDIKQRALEMAQAGADDLTVRDFITDSKKTLAFALPDEDTMLKAADAAKRFRTMTFNDRPEER